MFLDEFLVIMPKITEIVLNVGQKTALVLFQFAYLVKGTCIVFFARYIIVLLCAVPSATMF